MLYIGDKKNSLILVEYAGYQNKKSKLGKFKCACGKETITRIARVESNHTKTCGCGKYSKKDEQDREKGVLFSRCKNSSRLRHYEFTLTKEQFLELISKPCFYCGNEPSNGVFEKHTSRSKFNGIDRIDNASGYLPDNCVPCCKICNIAKNTMTALDFIKHSQQIAERWKK